MVYNSNKKTGYFVGGLAALALSGLSCASDPFADTRFSQYSEKTLVSTTEKESDSESRYVRNLKVKNWPLKQGNDGLSFVIYRLEIGAEKSNKKVASKEKAAEILEAGILRGEDVSFRCFESYASLDACLNALKTEETFLSGEIMVVSGKPVTGTALSVDKLEVKEKGIGKKLKYNTESPIAVVDVR